MAKKALVVEGGAMRGIFSCGVLDAFMKYHFAPFDFCIGVSAGSTNLAAYLCGQQGRNYKVITDYSCRREFISFPRFLRGGHWLDLDWLWQKTIAEIRLDLAAFKQQEMPLYIVATRIDNGQPTYIKATADNLEAALKASCAVPFAYRSYPELDGISYTDGGLSDSIPVEKAYQLGAREITVILSRPLGYSKKATQFPLLARKVFGKTPALAEASLNRANHYNRSLEFIRNPPADCKINLIAPSDSFAVGRTTTDLNKLNAGYRMGLLQGADIIENKLSR